MTNCLRYVARHLAGAIFLMLSFAAPAHAQLDPSILDNLKWDQLVWHEDKVSPGSWYAIVSGDPTQSGSYVLVNSIKRGNFNKPHSHPYDRQIYVVKGTWWVGSGSNFDPVASVGRGPGSYINQFANSVHWDGAKDEDVLLMISGNGPTIDNFVK